MGRELDLATVHIEELPYQMFIDTATWGLKYHVECGYSIADTQESWKYISELGYDPENPSVRHGTKVAASSSTGYADGQYTNKLDQTSDGLREWLSGGNLYGWSCAGRWYALLNGGLGSSWWDCAARLSASGRCAKAAA